MSAPEEKKDDGSASRSILVLDTDPGVTWALKHGLESTGYAVQAVSNVGDALRASESGVYQGVIFEYLPDAGLTFETLNMIAGANDDARIICTSIEAAPDVVIECMRQGAADFVPKPFSLSQIRASLARALASDDDPPVGRVRGNTRKSKGPDTGSLLIGVSPALQETRVVIEQIARTDLNCLIRGESGTGKDMVAREIHRLSNRSDQPFIKVNCTALPEQLLESELFGYEKGAFTGAVSSKPGRFELANNGMIFLDEIGDMHPNLQAKLLQVIEHKEFTKLGGTKQINVDVQIIAATNADLESHTREGLFRDDLYFRLNEVSIWVPPLSQRREDIPLLVRHFIQKHSRFSNENSLDISSEDLQRLLDYDWPGNVRELESTIKRWLALGQKVLPKGKGAPQEAGAAVSQSAATESAPVSSEPVPDKPMSEEEEREHVVQVLDQCQWNRRKAAEQLGMSYQTLRRRIAKYGLDAAGR